MIGRAGIRNTAWLVGLAGFLLFIAVVCLQGVGTVTSAVVAVGWGLLWISLFHLVPLLVDTWAWKRLLDSRHRIGWIRLTGVAWIGEAVNSLLPVALIGGGLARARLLHLARIPYAVGGASVVVDLTIAVATLLLFSLVGVAVLIGASLPGYSWLQSIAGLMLLALATGGFFIAQRHGMFHWLARRIERMNHADRAGRLANDAERLDRQIARIYQERAKFWSACLLRLAGWLLGAGEVWLALYYLGHPVTILQAVMLESLGQAVRSAAFLIPGALGVQEAAYLVLGAGIGLPPHASVALSLVKRVREVVLGLPALLVWHLIELQRFRHRPHRPAPMADERMSPSAYNASARR